MYGEFGPFYVGMVADPRTVLGEDRLRVRPRCRTRRPGRASRGTARRACRPTDRSRGTCGSLNRPGSARPGGGRAGTGVESSGLGVPGPRTRSTRPHLIAVAAGSAGAPWPSPSWCWSRRSRAPRPWSPAPAAARSPSSSAPAASPGPSTSPFREDRCRWSCPPLFGRGLSGWRSGSATGRWPGCRSLGPTTSLTDLRGRVAADRSGPRAFDRRGDVRIEVAPERALADSTAPSWSSATAGSGRARRAAGRHRGRRRCARPVRAGRVALGRADPRCRSRTATSCPAPREHPAFGGRAVLPGIEAPRRPARPLGIDSRAAAATSPRSWLARVPPASTVVAGPGTATTTEDPVTTTIAPTTIAPD